MVPTFLHTSHVFSLQVSGDFMSVLQDLIPETIPSHKRLANVGQNLSGYGDMGI